MEFLRSWNLSRRTNQVRHRILHGFPEYLTGFVIIDRISHVAYTSRFIPINSILASLLN